VFRPDGTEAGEPSVNPPHATESVSVCAGSPIRLAVVFAAAYAVVVHWSYAALAGTVCV